MVDFCHQKGTWFSRIADLFKQNESFGTAVLFLYSFLFLVTFLLAICDLDLYILILGITWFYEISFRQNKDFHILFDIIKIDGK